MRHRVRGRKLNITDGAHRRAMMRHIGNALILHEQINTTLPRAKELRRFIEPLITMGKQPSVHRRRLAFARLQNKDSVVKLFGDLGVRFASRPGGYVRVLKNGFRKGDNAPMALVEFVDKAPELEEATEVEAVESSSAKGGSKKKGAKAKSKSAKADTGEKAMAAESPEGAAQEAVAESAQPAESAEAAQPAAATEPEASAQPASEEDPAESPATPAPDESK